MSSFSTAFARLLLLFHVASADGSSMVGDLLARLNLRAGSSSQPQPGQAPAVARSLCPPAARKLLAPNLDRALQRKCGCACPLANEALTSTSVCPSGTAVQACASQGEAVGVVATETACFAYSSGTGGLAEVSAVCDDVEQHPTTIVASSDDLLAAQEVEASCECGEPIACTCHSPSGQCTATSWYPDQDSGSCSQFVPGTDDPDSGAKVYAICATCPMSLQAQEP